MRLDNEKLVQSFTFSVKMCRNVRFFEYFSIVCHKTKVLGFTIWHSLTYYERFKISVEFLDSFYRLSAYQKSTFAFTQCAEKVHTYYYSTNLTTNLGNLSSQDESQNWCHMIIIFGALTHLSRPGWIGSKDIYLPINHVLLASSSMQSQPS